MDSAASAGKEPREGPSLRITTTPGPGEAVTLALAGEVDIVTAPGLRSAIAEALAAGPRDLEQCSFIDSTGLQVIVQTGRALAEDAHGMLLRRSQAHVRRLFLTAGIERIAGLELEPDPSGSASAD